MEDQDGSGRKNSRFGGEDLKSTITTSQPDLSLLQARACLISSHGSRPGASSASLSLGPTVASTLDRSQDEVAGPCSSSLALGTVTWANTVELLMYPLGARLESCWVP